MSSKSESFQFSKVFEIGSFQVNPEGKLRWKDLADLFQEVAWRHADSADFGRILQEANQMWVLSRFEIKCEDLPSWGDQVEIFTAGRGVEGLFAFREFLMLGDKGKTLAAGMSSWLLLDSQSKKIIAPEKALPDHLFTINSKPAWIPERHRLKSIEKSAIGVKVRASDLDLQNHVNNTSYIRWVEDFMQEEGLKIESLSINYLAECFLGDQVDFFIKRLDSELQILGQVGEKKVFSAVVKI